MNYRLNKLWKNWEYYIDSNTSILCSKPVVKGTRIAVDLILENLSNNYSFEDIISAFPNLNHNSILACLAFASESVKNEIIYVRAL